ncbi:MAG: hypothetical protein AVDCRST_MAG01-01-875, partial [uncultured Rubrobacteraceae bacterium]
WRTKRTTTPRRRCTPCWTARKDAGRRRGRQGWPKTTSWRTSCAGFRTRLSERPGGCSPRGPPS